MKTPNFDELVGRDLPEAERERLRRVHDLLVAAGPPPELPQSLATPPIRTLRRRRVAALLLAAAVAVAAFGAGWVLSSEDDAFAVRRTVEMQGTANAPGAWGKIQLGKPDAEGNWQMLVTVSGLRPLPDGGYYELLLTLDGDPVATCGSFKVKARGATTVGLGASYDLSNFDGWVVRPYIHDREKFNRLIFLRT